MPAVEEFSFICSLTLTPFRQPSSFTAMVTTVEQTPGEWAHLLELARKGEVILITDQGRPVAKLSGLPAPAPLSTEDRQKWLDDLSALRRRIATDKSRPCVEELLEEDRSETVP